MNERLKALLKKREETLAAARAKLDEITDDTPQDRAQAVGAEHDEIMATYDSLSADIKREETLEQAQREHDASEEARLRSLPAHRTQGDPTDPGAGHREGAPTAEERTRRSELIARKFAHGERISDTEETLIRRMFPEEQAWWQYIRGGVDTLSSEQRQMLRSRYVDESRDAPLDAGFTTTGNVGTNADGGFTVPEIFVPQIIRAMKDYVAFLSADGSVRLAMSRTTPTGRDEEFPGVDDTGNEGALVSEGAHAGYSKLTFTQTVVKAYKFTTKVFPLSSEILQDSAINIEALLISLMAERYGRVLNKYLTVGTDSSQPEGAIKHLEGVSGRQIGPKSGDLIGSGLLDVMVDLEHKIDPAYRQAGQLVAMMHDNMVAVARKTKDSEGNPLWIQGDGITGGKPPTIAGVPYVVNQHMDSSVPTKAANSGKDKYHIALADWSKFYIRFARNMSIRRLDELGALSDQVLFVGFGRMGSKVLDDRAMSLVKTVNNSS